MSMFRSIQASWKYVPTKVWLSARDELIFSKVFDRMTELRNQSNLSSIQMKPVEEAAGPKTMYDYFLDSICLMACDFHEERKWKQVMAKQLAEEASLFAQSRKFSANYDSANYEFNERLLLEKLNMNSTPLYGFPGNDAVVPLKRKYSDDSPVSLFLEPRLESLTIENENTMESQEWTINEDIFLKDNAPTCYFAWNAIALGLNTSLHHGKELRSPLECQTRYSTILHTPIHEQSDIARAKRHLERISIMKAANTRIITPKNLVNKKLSLSAHPSHEAAARKANLSISKILTPSELALRRMQKQSVTPQAGTPAATPIMNTGSVAPSPGKIRPPQPIPAVNPAQSNLANAIRKGSAVPTPQAMFRPPMPPGGSPLPMQRMVMGPRPPLMPMMSRQQMLGMIMQQQQQQQMGGNNQANPPSKPPPANQ